MMYELKNFIFSLGFKILNNIKFSKLKKVLFFLLSAQCSPCHIFNIVMKTSVGAALG